MGSMSLDGYDPMLYDSFGLNSFESVALDTVMDCLDRLGPWDACSMTEFERATVYACIHSRVL